MGLFSGILDAFTGGGSEARLKKGLELAKAGRPDAAIKIYDGLLEAAPNDDFRARVLLNRALAFHALSDDSQAENDLRVVIASNQVSEAVRVTAREKLARVQKRMLRGRSRTVS